MCGIAGILSLAPEARVEHDALCNMAAQLVHRGPDDAGEYLDPQGRCGLGFRRLAILDLETGNQPIGNEDGSVWLIFNGEIYNFRELRQELERCGHRFRTRADSEVIVHLYERDGDGCFARLSGMFAIAIWDQQRGELLLARDRFGKKPLTYLVHAGRLYFASEAKAILALPGVPRELDPQSLHRYLLFQYVPAPHSIYRGFRKLPPGCFLRIRAGQAEAPEPRRYWQLPQPAPFDGSYDEAKSCLTERLTRALEKRLIADVPLGAFLSGGIDSSIVVALMHRLGVSPLRTFSIGFPDARYDETAYARIVAQRFGAEHREFTVTPDAREVLDKLAWHYDEPFADSSAIPTYYVAKCTRQHVTVALTGDGGDECFAGYDRYRAAQLAARLGVLPGWLGSAAAQLAKRLPRGRARTAGSRAHRFAAALREPPARQYLSWVNVFTPAMLAEGYRAEFRAQLEFDEPLAWFERLHAAAGGGAVERANRVDFVSYLPYDLLTKVDIASMAVSLECRCPFLDHELAGFALSLPVGWRLGKRILREWAADLLPRAVLTRGKMGFGVPVGEWFRGELRDLLEQNVLAPDGICSHVFRADWLGALVGQHVSRRCNLEHPLWALLMLERWHRTWNPRV